MKKLQLFMMIILVAAAQAQVTVSTITSNFKGSGGLSLDDDGNLYIGDFGDFLGMPDPDGQPNHVMQLDTDLVLTQFSTGFIGASGNDFDSNGILFQSDIRANAIYKIIGGVRTFVTSTGIVAPVGIVFDSMDNFYVCNCGNNTIQKVTPSGASTVFASGGSFTCPNGITIDENDNLYVSNFSNTNIVKITPSGADSVIGNTTAGNGNGHIDYDPNTKNLYIASYSGHKIFSLNIDDPIMEELIGTGVRGNTDGGFGVATFSTPNGIAVSKTGDSIYINCAVPLSGAEINPQIVRLITGVLLDVNENERSNFEVKTFPNPADDEITIQSHSIHDFSNLRIKVFNLLGKVLKETQDLNTANGHFSQTINIADLAAGTYLFTVEDASKQLFNGKFVKK